MNADATLEAPAIDQTMTPSIQAIVTELVDFTDSFPTDQDRGWMFYPYLFQSMYLLSCAEFITEEADVAFPPGVASEGAQALGHAALRALANGGAVLKRYRCGQQCFSF